MERLKAQRAAKAASEAKRTEAAPSKEASSLPSAGSATPTPPPSVTTIPSAAREPAPSADSTSAQPPQEAGSADAVSRTAVEVPLSGSGRTQTSTIYGRNGEEIEFDFHQLSDVP